MISLHPSAARRSRIDHREGRVPTVAAQQIGVVLGFIPEVGIAGPLSPLKRHDPGLEPPAARRFPALHLHRKGLYQHRAFREFPAPRGLVFYSAVTGQSDEPFLIGMVRPERAVDGIRDQTWRRLMAFNRREEPGLAQTPRECPAGVGCPGRPK